MASWRFVPWLILNPVILQVACALAVLLGSSMSIAPTGPAQALFKTVNRFVLQLELFWVYLFICDISPGSQFESLPGVEIASQRPVATMQYLYLAAIFHRKL